MVAVRFGVFVTPSVKRIFYPGYAVFAILLRLPGCVIFPFRFFGAHDLAEIFTQIGGKPFLMICYVGQFVTAVGMGLRQEREIFQRVDLGLSEEAGFLHLAEDDSTAAGRFLRAADGIEEGRVLTHADQHGSLFNVKVAWHLVKINAGSRADSHGVVTEIELVEVHVDDFFFGIKPL